MPKFNEFIKGFEEKPEAEQPKEQPKPQEHEITEAKLPESRFLKNDPYYKLVEEKKPKAYREHLFYPENGKIALHNTAGKKIKDFANEEEAKKWVDEYYSPVHQEVEIDDDYERSWGPERFTDDEIYEELGDNEYWYKGKSKEEMAKALSERKGISPERAAQFIEKYGTEYWGEEGKNPYNPQPKQGSFEQVFEEEEKPQPDGYYKDDNGEIYMMKGGKDYYPVGEAERQDFFRAFNNQNKEKAKEMANAPETAKSFERIYADLDKGFEETYKRKPTQEEKDAIRDIARLQAALVAMATKK